MNQLSSPLPPSPQTLVAAALPQSAMPDAALPASNQANATSFVEQLAKLLQSLTPQVAQTGVAAASLAAVTDQSGPSATAVSKPVEAEGAVPLVTPTPMSAAAQPQVSAPESLIVATALQAPDASQVRLRDAESGKPKAESTTPGRRASTESSCAIVPSVSVAPAPDSAAALQCASLAAPNVEPQHNSAPHQVGDHADSGSAAGTVSPSPSPSLKSEQSKPAAQEPQPPEVAPIHLSPSNQEACALQTASLADSIQPAPQPVRAAQPQAATALTGQHTSPTAQLTPALMQLGHAPDGAQRLTVRLDPPELGQVQIKIDRPSDAPARVEITVEKPETLSMLLRDQPQLQRALDQAGVPVEGRTVTFHVAAPEPPSRSDSGTAPVPNTNAGGLTGDGSHGAARQHTRSSRRSHDTADDDGAQFTPITASSWMRVGLDITA